MLFWPQVSAKSSCFRHAVNIGVRLPLSQEIVERELLLQRQQLANDPSFTTTAENVIAVVARCNCGSGTRTPGLQLG
jgi:hypothetical protein